eukprot:scaffold19162_cov118-Isochrysis_galbana.AAC.1
MHSGRTLRREPDPSLLGLAGGGAQPIPGTTDPAATGVDHRRAAGRRGGWPGGGDGRAIIRQHRHLQGWRRRR